MEIFSSTSVSHCSEAMRGILYTMSLLEIRKICRFSELLLKRVGPEELGRVEGVKEMQMTNHERRGGIKQMKA